MKPSLIFVVDPDPAIRALYATGLSVSGWAAEPIADGREALAKAISRRPAVVVTETRVPGLDGIELCRLLKRDPDTRHIPVLFVTRDIEERQLAKAKDAGADHVLRKPCVLDKLVEAIHAMLTLKTERASATAAPAPTAAPKVSLRRRAQSRIHRRGETTAPPLRPPKLLCPSCDRLLSYEFSYIGGVSASYEEQWDEYWCSVECGRFQYRQRTRKLRRLA